MNYSQRTYFTYLAYFAALIGMFASIALWLALKTTQSFYIHLLNQIQYFLPGLALISVLSISVLIAVLIYTIWRADSDQYSLTKMHDDLKNEVNERIAVEETKKQLEIALLQGQKLQAIGTLAGGIAHDFNNILYAIIGYTEMTREEMQADHLLYKNLGKVIEAAKKGQDLVSRILAFSRRQHNRYRCIDLKNTIETVLALLKPTIPASVNIQFQSDEIKILGDPTQIHQVFVNIINNAVDAMEGEGFINIHLELIDAQNSILKNFPHLPKKNYALIKISDTGHGMDKKTLERIFEPFFTTKEVGKGTGLGLAIAHSIIQEHQGEISVTSQLGKGTKFTLLIPENNDER